MSSKRELRTASLHARQQLSNHQIIDASLKALGFLKPLLPRNEWIGLYVPIKNELDVSLLFNQWTALPSIENHRLVFRAYEEPLIDGAFGTKESRGPIVEPQTIVVPGLAFDIKGVRLGYGKGYYDQYLTDKHCKIGLVHHQMMHENIPSEVHDVLMNQVVTDLGVIEVTKCIR